MATGATRHSAPTAPATHAPRAARHRRFVWGVIHGAGLVVLAALAARPACAVDGEPVRIVFDTDITGDCDDVLALAMCHTLADRRECDLLAVTVSKDNPLTAAFVDAVDTFYGRPDLPVGVTHDPRAQRRKSSYLEIAEADVFPQADVPVVQLSIDARLPAADHVEIGRRLAPLRDEGVMIVGSGNVVHHLGRISWGREGFGEPWAIEFDEAVRELAEGDDPARVIEVLDRPDAQLSVPTPEHFLPVAYIAGLASAANRPLRTLVAGCEMGSLSMRSFVLAD